MEESKIIKIVMSHSTAISRKKRYEIENETSFLPEL